MVLPKGEGGGGFSPTEGGGGALVRGAFGGGGGGGLRPTLKTLVRDTRQILSISGSVTLATVI